jgi:hypothetical protein
LARCRARSEAPDYCRCCPGGRGEAGEAGAGRWRTRKEGRALRAEGVGLGVWVEAGCGLWDVGAAGEVEG